MDLDTPQTRPRPQDPSSVTKEAGAQFCGIGFPSLPRPVVTRSLNDRHFLLTGPNQHDVLKATDQRDVLWTGKLVENTRAHTVDQT